METFIHIMLAGIVFSSLAFALKQRIDKNILISKTENLSKESSLSAVLSRDEIELIESLRERPRYFPDIDFLPEDSKAWTRFLGSETGKKLDLMMHNFWVQKQESALRRQNAYEQVELLRHAAGAWQGWNIAKYFSRLMAGANEEASNDGDGRNGAT